MKKEKEKEARKRRLTLSRETIQRLEDPQLLEQVRGGTSQVRYCTSVSYNEGTSDNC